MPAPRHPSRDARLAPTRAWINRNAVQVIVLCLASIATAAIILKTTYPEPPARITHVWFADSASGELVAVPHDALSPMMYDGRELWRAHLFACGDCEQPFVGYYTKYNAEALAKAEQRLNDQRRRALEYAERRRKAESEGLDEHFREEWDMEDEEEEYYEDFDIYGFGYSYPEGLLFSTDGVEWRQINRSTMRQLRQEVGLRCPDGKLDWCSPYPKPDELAALPEHSQLPLPPGSVAP